MADIMMDGRLELGVARGAYMFEYERMLPGLDAWNAGQMMRELIPADEQGNQCTGETVLHEVSNCYIDSRQRLVGVQKRLLRQLQRIVGRPREPH